MVRLALLQKNISKVEILGGESASFLPKGADLTISARKYLPGILYFLEVQHGN
jgi:hypothetical protein